MHHLGELSACLGRVLVHEAEPRMLKPIAGIVKHLSSFFNRLCHVEPIALLLPAAMLAAATRKRGSVLPWNEDVVAKPCIC